MRVLKVRPRMGGFWIRQKRDKTGGGQQGSIKVLAGTLITSSLAGLPRMCVVSWEKTSFPKVRGHEIGYTGLTSK